MKNTIAFDQSFSAKGWSEPLNQNPYYQLLKSIVDASDLNNCNDYNFWINLKNNKHDNLNDMINDQTIVKRNQHFFDSWQWIFNFQDQNKVDFNIFIRGDCDADIQKFKDHAKCFNRILYEEDFNNFSINHFISITDNAIVQNAYKQ